MRRLPALAPLLLATVFFLAPVRPADAQEVRSRTAAPSPPGASAILAAIEGSLADISTLQDQLRSLVAELEALADERPTRPGRDASEKEIAAWEQATRAWRARFDRLQARITALQAKSRKLEASLEAQRSEAAAVRPRSRTEGARLRALSDETALLQDDLSEVTAALKDLMRDSLRRTGVLRQAISHLEERTEAVRARALDVTRG